MGTFLTSKVWSVPPNTIGINPFGVQAKSGGTVFGATNAANDLVLYVPGKKLTANSSLYFSASSSVTIGQSADSSVNVKRAATSTLPEHIARTLPMEILEQCRKQFVKIAKVEQIEYGFSSASEALLQGFYDEYKDNLGPIVQHIFLREAANPRIIIPLLKGVSNFDYYDVYPYAQMVATAALGSRDPEIGEAGIRAFENWGKSEGIATLKNFKTPWPWLEEYRHETIAYLETRE